MSEVIESALPVRDLWHIVYASAAVPGFALAELQRILQTAREHNRKSGVTGILLFAENSFLQVLEGDPDVLDRLMARIRRDPRHERIVLLLRRPIADRSFADWTMGYTRVVLGELEDRMGVNDFFSNGDAFSDLGAAKVERLLDMFRTGSYRQRIS